MVFKNINIHGYLTEHIHGYMFNGMKTTLSERIKLAMEEGGFTQASLAESAGLSQPSVWKITSGKTKSSTKIVELARALRVRPEWLATGKGDMRYATTSTDYVTPNREPMYELSEPSYVVQIYDENENPIDFVSVPDFVITNQPKAFRLNQTSVFSEFPKGSMIVIDAGEKPNNNDFVYAKINNIPSVYKFLVRGPLNYLDVGDDRLPLIPVNDEVNILGVIVYMSRVFRT